MTNILATYKGVRTYTYHIKDGILYYCSDGQLIPQDFTGKRLERITGLCGIRDALREVIAILAILTFLLWPFIWASFKVKQVAALTATCFLSVFV